MSKKKPETFSVIIEFNCDNCYKRVTDLIGNVPPIKKYEVNLMCNHCNARYASTIRIIEDTSVYQNYRVIDYGVRRIGNEPENPSSIVGEVIME